MARFRNVPADGTIRVWAATAGALLALTAVVAGVVGSPIFHLRALEIRGERRLDERTITRRAGLSPQTNVLLSRMSDVERRLESDPWIREATVTRVLPSRVSIHIQERAPILAVRHRGAYVWVAEDGVSLGVFRDEGELTEVRGVVPPGPGYGSRELKELAQVVLWWDDRVQAEHPRLMVSGSDGLTVELRGGVLVHYGTSTAPGAKATALSAVLKWAEKRGVRLATVDIRNPRAPSAKAQDTGAR